MVGHLVAVFGGSGAQPGDPVYEDALRCGRLLAEAGFGVVTGGYGGVMEAASRGAREAQGRAIGITAPTVFPGRHGPNPYLTEERPAPSLTERIHTLLDASHAVIALPGSIGTFAELTMAWNLAFVARFSGNEPKPVVAVGPTWRHIVTELTAQISTDPQLVTCVDRASEAVVEVVTRLR